MLLRFKSRKYTHLTDLVCHCEWGLGPELALFWIGIRSLLISIYIPRFDNDAPFAGPRIHNPGLGGEPEVTLSHKRRRDIGAI